MLTSIALIFMIGFMLGSIFNRIKLPSLLGYMITGMILGPYVLNAIDSNFLTIGADLREIALVIILTRAGLSLNINDLKKVGRPALMMCFIPATLEILGVMLIAPTLLGVSVLEAALMGSVLAAVSPAVVVPRMIKLMEEGYGTKKSIPQLVVAGASVDDVYVIVLFTAFCGLLSTGDINVISFIQIPISIILGVLLGIVVGMIMSIFFEKIHMRDTMKIIVLLSVSFLLLAFEDIVSIYISVSALLAIMSMGITIKYKYDALAIRLSAKYNKLWIAAEVILFVLVGASVDFSYLMLAGVISICVVLGALVFRMIGVSLCLINTPLLPKERLFCMLAYTPKATVQAAIGSIPLSMGIACGEQVLILAVVAILVTAPFGAICVDTLHAKLLQKG